MKSLVLSALCTILCLSLAAQQVTISPSGITPAMSGAYPRLSYEAILALASPQRGDIAYDLTFDCLRCYNGSKWVCSTSSNPSQAVQLAIIASASGTGSEIGNGIAVDIVGNIYVTGYFTGTATFGNTQLTSTGSYDVFVAKYDRSGILSWVRQVGGLGDISDPKIAVEGSGNVYITGSFFYQATFGNNTLTSAGYDDIFVAKYNSSGTFLWARQGGSESGGDRGKGIAVDASGNVYVTGTFAGTAAFGNASLIAAGSYDIFVAKYNTTGTLQWVRKAGNANSDFSNDVAVDGTGNVYVTGYFQFMTTFGNTTLTSAGSYDIFLTKYNSNGTFQWVQQIGGSSHDYGRDIAIDGNGNIYLTGVFSETVTFGNTSITSAGVADVFVARYNTDGILQWVRQAGSSNDDSGDGIAVDGNGNIYVTGYFRDTAAFGHILFTPVGLTDIFVTKYDSNGRLLWAQQAGGSSFDYGRDIAVDGNGNVYVVGYFRDTASFGNTSATSAGLSDAFVARLQQ